jgi:hypothetical protein
MDELEEIESVSAEIHKCYCRAYERRFGKPYWTNGDYSKLDEETKNYDREMARWHLEQIRVERSPLREAEEAMKELLSSHFNLYKAHFGENSNPEVDAVRQLAKTALARMRDSSSQDNSEASRRKRYKSSLPE